MDSKSSFVSSKSRRISVKLSCYNMVSLVLLGASVAAITGLLAFASFTFNAPKFIGLSIFSFSSCQLIYVKSAVTLWLLPCKKLSMFKPPIKNNICKWRVRTGAHTQQSFKFIDIIESETCLYN